LCFDRRSRIEFYAGAAVVFILKSYKLFL